MDLGILEKCSWGEDVGREAAPKKQSLCLILSISIFYLFNCLYILVLDFISYLLPKYQPKRGGDLGWGKLFQFKCGIKNYFQLVKTNLRTQFNCNKIW